MYETPAPSSWITSAAKISVSLLAVPLPMAITCTPCLRINSEMVFFASSTFALECVG